MRILLRGLLAAVWLGMGLGAKVLGLVPRHREIVARILGEEHATTLTVLIGLGEILLAAWILTGRFPRTCAVVQIGLVLAMNLIEFTIARDLLLFGGWNLGVALAFIALVALIQWPRRAATPGPAPCSPG
jgi:hypothetical protein